MKYIINDGVLEKCIADQNKKVLWIPDTVKTIGPSAFADIPSGQIREIHFPDSIEEVHVRAFEGLGHLKKVYAYSCPENETCIYDIKDGEKVCGNELLFPLIADRLIILKGKRGDVFTLTEWFSLYPNDIYVPCDVRLKPITGENCVFDMNVPLIGKLTIYGNGKQLAKKDVTERINPAFASKLCLLNIRIEAVEPESGMFIVKEFHPEYTNSVPFRIQVWESGEFSDEAEIRWQTFNVENGHFGLNDLPFVKEVILPRGLSEINNEINHCESLKKLIIPSSVESICSSVRDCPSLTNVSVDIHTDERLRVDTDCFMNCPELKTITLYEISPQNDTCKTVMKVPKTQWLKYHFIDDEMLKLFEKQPRIADDILMMTDCDHWTNFYGRVGEQRKTVLKLRSLSEDSGDNYTIAENNDLRDFLHITDLIERISSFE